MAEKSSAVAKLAFALSIITAGFSFYQWRHAEEQSSITATVDYSIKYYQDADVRTDRRAFVNIWEFATNKDIVPEKNDWNLVFRHFERMDYIARLINTGKFNLKYVSDRLICDLQSTSQFLSKVKLTNDDPGLAEIGKYKGTYTELKNLPSSRACGTSYELPQN
jgi:hypothetical protein